MFTICLDNYNVFFYKNMLFFVGKIGVIKIKLPNCLSLVSFRLYESCIKIATSKLDKANCKLIGDIFDKINKILIESSNGFTNKITLFGIGFRSWAYKSNNGLKYLVLKIGFSKDLSVRVPFAVKIIVLKSTLILFKSLDKEILNQFVASVRLLKVPDSYKGKGLRYIDEKIVLKVGKT